MTTNVGYTLHTIHLHDATLDEEESWLFLQQYNASKTFNTVYKYPQIDIDTIQVLASTYALFYAKIKDEVLDVSFQSNTPLQVFRYMMMEDGSWSNYYTIRRKPGYVVEGMYWSNGMVYQVRSDAINSFEIYELTLNIDNLTKTMYNFPDVQNL